MSTTCTCGRKLDFFVVVSGLRSYCSGCGASEVVKDDWPLTLHWLRDHRSHHLTQEQAFLIAARNRSYKPKVCTQCGWPSSIGEVCMLCCDMNEAIMAQKGLMFYHEIWQRQRRERKLGLL